MPENRLKKAGMEQLTLPPRYGLKVKDLDVKGSTGRSKEKVYLCQHGKCVGPFYSRADAKRFIELVRWFGGDCDNIELIKSE